jgi:hypothetical protein
LGQEILTYSKHVRRGGDGSPLQVSKCSVPGTGSLTVGITDTLITAKAKVSYNDRELGLEGEDTLHGSTSVL